MARQEAPARELAECRRRVTEVGRELEREAAARQRAEDSLSEIFSVVSHRLRAPLASLLGITDLMLDHDYPAERQRYFLASLRSEARRLTDFLTDFLDLQALESGRSPYDFQPLRLDEILGQTVELFSGRHPERPFRLEVVAGLKVRADRDRLQQVLRALIENAVKYSPDGTEVRLSAHRENGCAVVSIADRGAGVAEEHRERIFERFYRAQAISGRAPGAGLGLTIAARIVDDHQGEIRLESDAGAGSTFSIVLPLGDGES